jgi:tropinone reductase I
MTEWNLKGKTALITGGTHGIGYACAEEFAALGANVIVVARNEQDGMKYPFIQADITQALDRKKIAEQVKQLDILVNNVGMNIPKKTADFSSAEIASLLDSNFIANLEMIRLLLPILKKSANASIINIASIAGVMDVGTGSIYGASKAALIQLTKSLAREYAEYGIRVNAVSPWFTETRRILPILIDKSYSEKIIAATPLNRIATVAEIAAAVAFLAMDKSSYITGQNLIVDGGMGA